MMKSVAEMKNRVVNFFCSDSGRLALILLAVMIAYLLFGRQCDALTAMAVVAGVKGGSHVSNEPLTTRLSNEAAPELLRNEIDSRIVKVRPMATPIDQISRYGNARGCGSMVVEYYSVDTKPVEAKVVKATPNEGASAGSNCIPTELATDNDGIFEISETLMFPDVEASEGGPLVVYVYEKDGKGGMMVIPVNNKNSSGEYRTPAIAAGSRVVRMGRAASELDVQTAQFESLPVKSSNNCQIFKAQVEQSTYQKIANKEVGWSFSDQEEAAIVDMRRGMEANFLFGSKNRIYDPSKREEILLTGGIWNQTEKTGEYTIGALDYDKLVELCRLAFTGNGGSSKKILVGGTMLIEQLHKLDHIKVIGSENTMTKWGLDFSEIVTKFGRLYVISSEMFDVCGHANDGMIIDPEYITKYCHVPFRSERLNLRASGVRNTDAIVITEASCLVLRYPDAHLRIVGKSV